MPNNLANLSAADAQALRGLQIAADQGFFPVGCRTGYTYGRTSTSTANPRFLCRTRHILPYGAKDIQLLYAAGYTVPAERGMGGFSGLNVGMAPYWNAPIWTAYDKDAIKRMTRNGKFGLDCASGEFILTDRIGVARAPGDAIGLQHYIGGNTDAAQMWGGRLQAPARTWGDEYCFVSNSLADLSLTPTGWPTGTSGRGAITPVAILGRAPDGIKRSSILIIGHSIAYGSVQSGGGTGGYDPGDDDGNCGWIERTINSARPWTTFTAPGDRLMYWMGNDGTNKGDQRWGIIPALGVTDAIMQIEINDLGSGGLTQAQYLALLEAAVERLSGMGIRVHVVTAAPQTTSTDSWATQENQTVTATGTKLLAYNDWLRANYTTIGIASIIDLAVIIDPNETGKWRTDFNTEMGTAPTLDGTHFTPEFTAKVASLGVFDAEILVPEFPVAA